jgi:hypothetical protein
VLVLQQHVDDSRLVTLVAEEVVVREDVPATPTVVAHGHQGEGDGE